MEQSDGSQGHPEGKSDSAVTIPAIAEKQGQLSPDGHYWWNGAEWIAAGGSEVALSSQVAVGVQGQFSPDGRHWWNGQSWVPTQAPAAPIVYATPFPSSKSKIAAGLLAIFFGDIGVHKFYLGQVSLGLLYLIFCWTFIPGLIALIEGIVYLSTSEAEWARRYPAVTYGPTVR